MMGRRDPGLAFGWSIHKGLKESEFSTLSNLSCLPSSHFISRLPPLKKKKEKEDGNLGPADVLEIWKKGRGCRLLEGQVELGPSSSPLL